MTNEHDEVREVETVEELIREVGVRLLSVQPFKLSGERDDDFDGTVPESFDVDHEESVRFALAPNRIAVRLITKLSIKSVCAVEIDYAAEFEPEQPVHLSVEALQGFINRVAAMQIWPYTRQAAQDMFLRVINEAVPLPVVSPDDFNFGPAGDDETDADGEAPED
ncbi:hypothetical protein [Demequina zhanjiangensis]|uniref:Preprotein translocase subunit SecB n=1 Tax=Demequina zhanjiangensis TaxID=3051659 RepID=A0ABT8G3M1_9MICO|nr:hypothetical protein [Demequina sp. SYSU T00b26]MDN4473723.1 hypothetical protein [Demequina sp. SYSU T00b26]